LGGHRRRQHPLTRNGGKNWTLVNKKIAGMPAGYCVSTVSASTYEEGAAMVTLDGHTCSVT
jgi:hypothetical protein